MLSIPTLLSQAWPRFTQRPFLWLLPLHLLLGAVVAWQPWALPILLYTILGLYAVSPKEGQLAGLPFLLLSLLPIELMGRMSGGSPWVPWELGKYAMIGLLLHALYRLPRAQVWWPGSLWIGLSVPAFLLTLQQSARWWPDWVFNGFGLLALALGCMVFGRWRISPDEYRRLLLFGLSSWGMGAAYIALNSELPWQITYTLYATYELCGGFNPNQVATFLSFGMLLTAAPALWQNRHGWRLMPAYLLISGWVWLTFSRGGLYSALPTLLLTGLLAPIHTLIPIGRGRKLPYLAVVIALSAASFALGNAVSGGLLQGRYQGDRPDIISGETEKSLDTYVSHRWGQLQSDWAMFKDYFPWGTGVGQSRPKRMAYGLPENFPPHTEASRLLAEHGLPGLFMLLLFLGLPVYLFFRAWGHPTQQVHYLLFFGLAILSSAHSAMRTMLTPLLYSLAMLQLNAPNRTPDGTAPPS